MENEMIGERRWRPTAMMALLLAALLALGLGCGDEDQVIDNDGSEDEVKPVTDEEAHEYIMEQEAVIMPWTRHVEGPLIEQAVVEADRITFPASGNEATVGEFELGDVLVSADPDKAFLRKITDLEHTADTYVVHTRDARIEEAVYKGDLSPHPPGEGQPLSDDGVDTRPQYSQPDKESFGSGSTSEEDEDASEQSDKPIKFSMNPSVNISPSFYFDMKIEPSGNRHMNQNNLWSPYQRCEGDNGGADVNMCAPVVSGRGYESYCGEHDGDPYVCQFRQERFNATCDTVVASLDFAEQNPQCKEMFDKFYAGEYGADAYNTSIWGARSSPCRKGGISGFFGSYWMPPHPVHVDWAKKHCSGAIKRVVVDGQVDASATTGDIKIEATTGWKSDEPYTIWKSKDYRLARKVFFIGWLPVLITSNASLRLDAEYEATLGATLEFEGISLTGLTFGGGFNKYAASEYEDHKGVYVGGRLRRYSQGNYGQWQGNPWRTPNPQLSGFELKNKEVIGRLEGTMSGKLSVVPRVDLLLYNLAGPFVEPVIPSAEVKLSAGGELSNIEGFGNTGGMCNDMPINVCARVGVEGRVGITAANICEDCEWEATIDYQDFAIRTGSHDDKGTCSDFCPENNETLCAKWCYFDGEPPKAIEVVLEWDNDAVDFDLRMARPQAVDYTDDSPTSEGWLHSGDSCPDTFSGCSEVLEDGVFKETIELVEGFPKPSNSTLYSIEVETFKSNISGGTFDLVVYEDGNRVQTFRGETAPALRDSKTFEFTLR
jgi:hypothetical protein